MPTLVHITDRPIERWSNSSTQSSGQYKIERKGKPAGFWYAYEKEWYRFYYKNEGRGTLYKYTVNVPSSSFTLDVGATGKTKIVCLTPTNIGDFVRLYVERISRVGVAVLRPDPIKRLQELIWEDLREDAGHFDDLRGNLDYDFVDFLEEMFEDMMNGNGEENEEGEEEDRDEDRDEEENEEENNEKGRAQRRAIAYQILTDVDDKGRDAFQWPVFWDAVREQIGGVEFSADFFDGRNLNTLSVDGINLSWIKRVDIRSGVLFKPRTFFQTLGLCPTFTHLFTGAERQRLKTLKGKRRRQLLKRLMTRKGARVVTPACNYRNA